MDWHSLLLTQVARLALGGGLLLYLTYKLAEPWLPADRPDRQVAGLLWFWLALTMIPLVLVQLRVYELVGIWMTFLAIAAVIVYVRNPHLNVTLTLLRVADRFLRWMDRLSSGPPLGRTWEGIAVLPSPRELTEPAAATAPSPPGRSWSSEGIAAFAAAVLVLAVSGVERFIDMWLHPGPQYADSGPHLKWLTEMLLNITYKDGAYSLGMHAFISIFRPLVGLDLVADFRIWGPLASLIWVGTTMWVGAKLSGSKWGGVLAGTLAGWIGDGSWRTLYRQKGTLPQEFGWVWLMPALWWSYAYLRSGKRQDLVLALAAITVTGASHFGNHAFLLLGLAGMGLALLGSVPFRRTVTLAGWTLAVSVIAEWHVIWGLLRGHPVAGNNAAYLPLAFAQAVPPIVWIVLGAGMGLLLLSEGLALISLRSPEGNEWRVRMRWVLALFLVWGAFWQIARTGLGGTRLGVIVGAFSNRGLEYVFMSGIMLSALVYGEAERWLRRGRWGRPAVWLLALGLLLGAFSLVPAPTAFSGARQLSDELVTAVRVLGAERAQGDWVAVGSRNLYPIALGQCQEVDDFRFWDTWKLAPTDARGMASVVKELVGYSKIEVLAFIDSEATYPEGEMPPESQADARRAWQDQYGAWGLTQMIGQMQQAGMPLAVVWEGPGLKVYRIWSPEQADTVRLTGGQENGATEIGHHPSV